MVDDVKKIAFVILILLVSYSSYGFHGDYQDEYDRTLVMCEGTNLKADLLLKKNLFLNGVWETINFEVVDKSIKGIKNKEFKIKLGSGMEDLISSNGFFDALQTCYGDNQLYKDLFFFSLIGLDVSSKATATLSFLFLNQYILARLLANYPVIYYSLLASSIMPPIIFHLYLDYKLKQDSSVYAEGFKRQTEAVKDLRKKIFQSAIRSIIEEFKTNSLPSTKYQERVELLILSLEKYSKLKDLQHGDRCFIQASVKEVNNAIDENIIPRPENNQAQESLKILNDF